MVFRKNVSLPHSSPSDYVRAPFIKAVHEPPCEINVHRSFPFGCGPCQCCCRGLGGMSTVAPTNAGLAGCNARHKIGVNHVCCCAQELTDTTWPQVPSFMSLVLNQVQQMTTTPQYAVLYYAWDVKDQANKVR